MNLLKKLQYYIVPLDEIERTKKETQEAAHMLIRRDVEISAINEKLRQLNDAKSDFVTMAAHQLRTPIATIKWHSELLLDNDDYDYTPEQQQYLRLIRSSVRHMAELIDTLLYISRLELGTNTSLNSMFDLSNFVNHVGNRFSEEMQEQQISPHFELEPVVLFADRSLFDLILQNLISNAIKYTPVGGSLTTGIRLLEAGNFFGERSYSQTQLCLWVSDTGYGIPAEQQDKIFNRMFRASNVQNLGINGTGLGLYLVRLVVTKMGGEVWFTTQENQGTTFFISIPYALVKAVEG